MNNLPGFGRASRYLVAARVPLCVAFMAVACIEEPQGGGGSGGGASSSGGSGSGGASSSGGSGSGGASSSGGSGSGGRSSSGGAGTGGASSSGGAGTGGASSSGGATGSGGSSGRGGSASGGSIDGGTGGAGGTRPGGAAVPSAGCGRTSTITFGAVPGESGQNVGTGQGGYVTIGSRGFAMRLPDNYDRNRPYWLIFGFHWNGGNSKEVDTGGSNLYNMAHFGLQKLSKNGAIFVAPDGLNGGWGSSGDLKFVDDMVKLIQDNYCVDTTHLFANGFSYGGGMSYAIACGRAKVFRGVAIYNGAVLSGCEGGTDPIAYWQMAGLTDTVCTVGAGEMMRDRFVRNNGCTAQNPPKPPQPPPYLVNGGHICTNYTGCSSGHPIRWCVHQSGHGNAIVDGTADLYHMCANPGRTCSDSCRCSWVPEDVWSWMNSL
jgi:hypothetical protein